MDQLRRRFPHTLLLGFAATRPAVGAAPSAAGLSRRDHDVAREFLVEMRGCEPDADELALLDLAVDSCCDDRDDDRLTRARVVA